jgi:hypothetical protein
MQPFTLNQAAKACNKSKSAILNAISNGRLSAVKGDIGQWEIQPSELFRVYPSTGSSTRENLPDGPPIEHPSTSVLLERLAGYERDINRLESERDYLQEQLEDEKRERRQLMQMLTHQPEPTAPAQNVTESKLLLKLFGKKPVG